MHRSKLDPEQHSLLCQPRGMEFSLNEVGLSHPINPNTYQIKTTDADRNGSRQKEGRDADLAKGAVGLLMLERLFVNAPAVLIFDPNRVSSLPLVLSHLKRPFEVAGLSSDYPSRHIAPIVTRSFA